MGALLFSLLIFAIHFFCFGVFLFSVIFRIFLNLRWKYKLLLVTLIEFHICFPLRSYKSDFFFNIAISNSLGHLRLIV